MTVLLFATSWVAELQSLVNKLVAEVRVLFLCDLLLGLLGSWVLSIEAVNVIEFRGEFLGLVTASASWDWALGEADLSITFNVFDALNWLFVVSSVLSHGFFSARRR